MSVRRLEERFTLFVSNAKPVVSLSVERCENFWHRCVTLLQGVRQAQDVIWQRSADRVGYLEKLVQGASPETQLKRGFALVKRSGGEQILTAASELHPGDEAIPGAWDERA